MLVVLAVTLLLVSSLLTPNTAQILPYSDVLDLFRNEKVASFTLEGSNLTMQVRGDDGDYCLYRHRKNRQIPSSSARIWTR